MEQNNGYVKGLFIGTLAGGLIGSITALLYAAKSGKELRKDIKNRTNEFYDDTEKFISDAKIKAGEKINDGKKLFEDAKGKIDSMVLSGKEIVDDEIDNIQTSFQAGLKAYKETTKNNNKETTKNNNKEHV